MQGVELNEKSIFNVARRIDSPQVRDEYLKQVCGDNAAMLRRVAVLLESHENYPAYLEPSSPEVAPTIDQPITETPNTYVGRYKLIQEIGQGGMGVVYMAVQKEPVKRKVALKIIKPGMDTREVVARFEAERQALALMDHQCIATVLDGGSTESGRPYFVMELVEGTPINEYADACRYTTRQRLELFVQVCQAVQHAHQKGIIHRDIKPSNILVTTNDDKAVPKVIDFGIAKAVHHQLTDASVYTHVSQMIGTPLFMSPEQAQRTGVDVDTRTDVYSLGVLLYELLTGMLPFDKEKLKASGLDEFKRIIREEEPPKPSTRLSTVDAALETIADKHDADLRTLTRELSGELDWIVMKALEKDRTRRYESASDFAKDIQRHLNDEPVEACPQSTAYRMGKYYRRNKVALLTSAAFALVVILGAGLAGWQAVRATRALSGESQQRGRAESNLQLAMQALDDFFLKSIGEERLLDDSSDVSFDQPPTPDQQPLTESERKLIRQGLGFYDQFAQQNAEHPETLFETGKAYCRVAMLQAALDEDAEAEAAYEEAIERLEGLVKRHPANPEYFLELGRAYYAHGKLNRWRPDARGTFGKAEKVLTRAIELAPGDPEAYKLRGGVYYVMHEYEKTQADNERVAELDPDNAAVRRLVAGTWIWVSDARLRNRERALQHAQEALRLDPKQAESHALLAHVLAWYGTGDVEAAAQRFKSAIELTPDLKGKYALRCEMYRYLGDHRQVIENASKCLELDETSRERIRRIAAYRQLGRFDEALADLTFLEKASPNQWTVYKQRGEIYHAQGRYEEAITEYNRGLELAPRIGILYCLRGDAHNAQKRYEEAFKDYDKAIELEPQAGSFHIQRGLLYKAQGAFEKATTDFSRAIELNPNVWYVHERVGQIFCEQGRYEEAIAKFSRAIELNPDEYWGTYVLRGDVYYSQSRYDEALKDYDQAIQLGEGETAGYHYYKRGEVHSQLGHDEEALADYDRSIKLDTRAETWYFFKRRAVTHFRLRAYDRVLADLAKALELNPQDLSTITWISPHHVAACPNRQFKEGILRLAGRAIELNPGSAGAYARRMVLYDGLGEQDKARADREEIYQLETVPPKTWYRVALFSLGVQDQEEYRKACKKILEDFAESSEARTLFYTVWTCALGPDAVEQFAPLIALAEKAVDKDSKSVSCLGAFGASLYRAGRVDEAIQRLAEANKLIDDPKIGTSSSPAYTWYFLAMAHQANGQPEQAKLWLDKAVEWTDEVFHQDEDGTAPLAWNRRLTLKILREEAKAMIYGDD